MASYGARLTFKLKVIEMSQHGFQAECEVPLPEGTFGLVEIDLGEHETAHVKAVAVRRSKHGGVEYYGFKVSEPDLAWRACVQALNRGRTHADLADHPQPQAGPPAMGAAADGTAAKAAAQALAETA